MMMARKATRNARLLKPVSANTPEGKQMLEKSFRQHMDNMTRESALVALAKTGMYDAQGRIKEEYR